MSAFADVEAGQTIRPNNMLTEYRVVEVELYSAEVDRVRVTLEPLTDEYGKGKPINSTPVQWDVVASTKVSIIVDS